MRDEQSSESGRTTPREQEKDDVEVAQIDDEENLKVHLRKLSQDLKNLGHEMAEFRDALRAIVIELRTIRLTKGLNGGDPQYEVAEVVDSKLDHRSRACPLRYKVRWAGFEGTREEYTWVSPFELGSALEVVTEFHLNNPDKPRRPIVDASVLSILRPRY